MIVRIDKAFEKDVRKIRDAALLRELAHCILEIESIEDTRKIRNLKKIQGSKSFYRIKLNDYRLGVQIEGKHIDLIRFLHRKDVYKFFP